MPNEPVFSHYEINSPTLPEVLFNQQQKQELNSHMKADIFCYNIIRHINRIYPEILEPSSAQPNA